MTSPLRGYAQDERFQCPFVLSVPRRGKSKHERRSPQTTVIGSYAYYVETSEEIAERVRGAVALIGPERLFVNPDCGFFHLPRGVAYQKMKHMVEGARLVRRELGAAE